MNTKKFIFRVKKFIFRVLTASALLAVTFALAGCAEPAPIFTCANGTAQTGAAPGNTNFEQCVSCESGFRLEGARGGDRLDGARCIATAHTCANGTPTAGSPAGNSDVAQCARCNVGFLLTTTNRCTNDDSDNDGILDARDVDDDGDGLIEIYTLDDLSNVRFNLAGTGYQATSGGANDTTGCGTMEGNSCNGYELMRSLDFADGASYANGTVNSDWRPNNDSPDNATNEGWEPIGDSNVNNQFNTVFEGNGFTISNLYARRSSRVGLFGETGSSAVLRNIGIVNYRLYGSSGNDEIGGLVGRFSGRISTSHATGNANGGAGDDNVGGLVGSISTANNSIIASYATATLNGGAGGDGGGGLVGRISSNNNRITASYATGNANGGNDNDSVGRLVGFAWTSGGAITASYATGNVDGGDGTDAVGSLLGQRIAVSISESYGFGTTSNGTANTLGIHPNSAVNSAVVLSEAGTSAPTASTTNAGPQWTNSATNPTWQWDFGTNTQNPALVVDFNGDGTATWEEFGSQPR